MAALPWLTFSLAILTALVLPTITAVWRISVQVVLMEEKMKQQEERLHQAEEDIALMEEGSKIRTAQLEELKVTLTEMKTMLGLLVKRSGIELPQIGHKGN